MKKNKKRLKHSRKIQGKNFPKITGTLSTASGGFGFVNTNDGFELFIPPSSLNGALDGDTVEAAVTKLMYLQGKYDDNDTVRHLMTQSLCGEITM